MKPLKGLCAILAGLVSLTDAAPGFGQPAPGSAENMLLRQIKEACGGQAWDSVSAVVGEGEKKSYGLNGVYRSVEQLPTGYFLHRADYPIFSNAEGVDRKGRWRIDNSGQLHALDSAEAKAVAISESYLVRRGYLFPEKIEASFRLLSPITEERHKYDRIEVSVPNGRSLTLWIDETDHLVERAEMNLSTVTETIRYSDYRVVEGLRVPFTISVDNGDWPETGTAQISRCTLSRQSADEPARPKELPHDARILGGESAARARGHFDPASKFYIIEMKINDQAPLPFILDTGGHDILTRDAAAALKLKPIGAGVSNGAGASSVSTQFVKVAKVSLGNAEMLSQPFLVMSSDLGATKIGNRQVAVAGIVGLELFERFVVTLDYRSEFLELRSFRDQNRAHHGTVVPIQFTNDTPLVSAKLDGHVGTFAVDTGNNVDVIVYGPWAETNGLAAKYERSGKAIKDSSLGGSIELLPARGESFLFGEMELGEIPLLLSRDEKGSLSSRSEAGNVGLSVLSKFVISFDYLHETMTLAPVPSVGS